jgi:hypothetical protein
MGEPLTYDELAAVLRVDGADLLWRVTRGKARAGQRAGRQDKQGYIVLQYRGVDLQAHRVVWLLTHGEWPSTMLDHRDGERANNSPDNLRPATNSQNQANRKASSATGFKGVTMHETGKFQAQCAGKYLGLFSDAECAARVYDAVARRTYGEFARLNFGGAS